MKDYYTYHKCRTRHRKHLKLLLYLMCLLLFISGIILFLGNEDIISVHTLYIIFSWQTLLITLGLFFLIVSKARFRFLPTILIIVGIVFLLENIYGNFSNKIWAILLISFGIILFLRLIIPKRRNNRTKIANDFESISEDFIKKLANFEKLELVCESQNFKGGEINLVFSGGTIDLTKAHLSEGINILKIDCFFSGIKIFVPQNWDISFESVGAFGGINDNRKMIIYENIDKSKKLLIKSEMIFGGGEILSE